LVVGGYTRATELLKQNRDKLEEMAQALLEHETLNAKDIQNILDGKDISNNEDSGTPQNLKNDEAPTKKIEPKSDSEEGLLGGGMPDPSPA